MQNRVGVQDARIADVLRAVDQARENLLARLLRRDGAPIWSPAFLSSGAQQLQEESLSSFSAQWTALSGYAERHALRLGLGILIFIGLAAGLFRTRRVARGLSAEKSDTAFKAPVFEAPISTALLLALFASRWINPQAPRLLWVMLGAVSLIRSVIIVHRIIPPKLRSLPYVLMVFFFMDLLRTLAAAVPFLPRLLFLVAMLCAILLSLWLIGIRTRRIPSSLEPQKNKWIIFAGYVALSISMMAFLANVLGYVTLANLLGNSLLGSGYTALILYALVVVLDQLGLILLHLRPLASLGAVSRHRSLLHRRMRRVLERFAILLWVLGLLQMLLLRERLFNAVLEFLRAELSIGSFHISLGDVLAFIVTVWAAFALSRFISFLLEEDIYPRVRLERGLPYAI